MFMSLGLMVLIATMAFPAFAGSGDGYLGVHLQELDAPLRRALDLPDGEIGVLVADVVADGPAAAAGIEKGDVILRFDGATVRSTGGLTRKVRRTDPGSAVEVELFRRGERRTVEVELAERELSAQEPFLWRGQDDDLQSIFVRRPFGGLGVRVEELDPTLGRYFGTDDGLLVLEVIEDSPAETAGLRRGDVLTSIDGDPLRETEDLQDHLLERSDGETVQLVYLRDRSESSVAVDIEEMDDLAWRVFTRTRRGAPRMHFFHHGEPVPPRAPAPDAGQNVERWFELHRGGRDLEDELDTLREQVEELQEQLKKLEQG
jgi:C-terminal processing protease CtpA/Prc